MSITSNTPETVTLVKEDTANKNTFKVTLNLDNPTITTTTNGTVQLTSDNYINNVSLVTNVVPASQTKTVTITENGTTAITPDNNIPYLDSVIVNTNVPQPVTSDNKISKMKTLNNKNVTNTLTLTSVKNLSSNTNLDSFLEDRTVIYPFKNTTSSTINITTTKSALLFTRPTGNLNTHDFDRNNTFIIPAKRTVFINRRTYSGGITLHPELYLNTSNNTPLLLLEPSATDSSSSNAFLIINDALLASDFIIPVTPDS